jgi:rhodanese-related sulfurtransferase
MLIIALAFLPVIAFSQRAITNTEYAAWLSAKTDFILMDVRGDAVVDSLLRPCFYLSSTNAIQWADSLGCRKRLLLLCHTGVLAAQTADSIVRKGYPADSVYSSGYSLLTATRYPAADTLPVAYLGTGGALPQTLTAYQLWTVSLSKRHYRMIDVRAAGEIALTGLIPGACNIAWPTPFQTASASLDKTADIILNCASGGRAGQAKTYLQSNGFDAAKVINFGGFSNWSGTPGVPVSATPSTTCECTGIERGVLPLSGASSIIVSPNPFGAGTRIRFNLPSVTAVEITDIRGRTVEKQGASQAKLKEGLDFSAARLPSGIYLLRVIAGPRVITEKLIVSR